jgi:hypothetical protein
MHRARDVRVVSKYLGEELPIGDVSFIERPVSGKGSVADDQRIEDDRLVASIFQGGADGAPNVSGPAGDQYFHISTPDALKWVS